MKKRTLLLGPCGGNNNKAARKRWNALGKAYQMWQQLMRIGASPAKIAAYLQQATGHNNVYDLVNEYNQLAHANNFVDQYGHTGINSIGF